MLAGWKTAAPVFTIVLAIGLLVVIVGPTTGPDAPAGDDVWAPGSCEEFTPGTPEHDNCFARRDVARSLRPLVIVDGRYAVELADPAARERPR